MNDLAMAAMFCICAVLSWLMIAACDRLMGGK
ncbi:hypothetical protein PLANPX_0856 [Lacipirellula parvula]|uniref:Uncharacterized protein n=1 Tax=Lacipirellula parvula TaxID=2650471 RepID=A0A5K7X3K6_9BACT|nr:hypothetical protein PLANPX_0856 [Lacipirellula parvula]